MPVAIGGSNMNSSEGGYPVYTKSGLMLTRPDPVTKEQNKKMSKDRANKLSESH